MLWLARGPGLRRRWRAGTWPSAANFVVLPPGPSPPRSRSAQRRVLVFGGDVTACLVPFGHVFVSRALDLDLDLCGRRRLQTWQARGLPAAQRYPRV